MEFVKMHGLGNDFILLDHFLSAPFSDYEGLARKLCHRQFGVGGDGLLVVLPSGEADVRMRIFNPDGSEPEMCGNGIRCLARYAYERGYVQHNPLRVETLAGILSIGLRLARKADQSGEDRLSGNDNLSDENSLNGKDNPGGQDNLNGQNNLSGQDNLSGKDNPTAEDNQNGQDNRNGKANQSGKDQAESPREDKNQDQDKAENVGEAKAKAEAKAEAKDKDKDKVESVRVDMGEPVLDPESIPVRCTGKRALGESLEAEGRAFRFTAVSMGNPHCVIFGENLSEKDFYRYGPLIEKHPLFPRKTNVEFITVHSRQEMTMRVWERGAGPTLACGTGASAAAVAAVLNDLIDREVTVHLPGGDLLIEWAGDNHVYMTGPAVYAFRGVWLEESTTPDQEAWPHAPGFSGLLTWGESTIPD